MRGPEARAVRSGRFLGPLGGAVVVLKPNRLGQQQGHQNDHPA